MSNKPIIELLKENPGQSFVSRRIIRNARPSLIREGVWHYHPDYEITLTIKSKGKRFVGYNISDYSEFDLVLIGDHLPHCWITTEKTDQLVINFKKEQLGAIFWKLPEMGLINDLLKKSQQGILFDKQTANRAYLLMLEMEHLNGFDKLLGLFQLLNLMARAKNQEQLSFYHGQVKDSLKASSRIEKIYSYILDNYQTNEISFTELTSDLNMTKSSVCRFIKKITKKSFSQIVIETRVNEACKLLAETDMYISQICFTCGFNNISNFNRAFKKINKLTPKAYRLVYRVEDNRSN